MAGTASTWLIAPSAHLPAGFAHLPAYLTRAPVALGFLAFGAVFLCNAIYLWSKPDAHRA